MDLFSFIVIKNEYVLQLVALAFFVFGLLLGKSLSASRSSVPGRRSKNSGDKNCELYVGNLAYETTNDDLKRMFTSFGKIASARIITNRTSGKSKGYGFVQMVDDSGASAAIKGLSSEIVKGRRIVVSKAKQNSRSNRR